MAVLPYVAGALAVLAIGAHSAASSSSSTCEVSSGGARPSWMALAEPDAKFTRHSVELHLAHMLHASALSAVDGDGDLLREKFPMALLDTLWALFQKCSFNADSLLETATGRFLRQPLVDIVAAENYLFTRSQLFDPAKSQIYVLMAKWRTLQQDISLPSSSSPASSRSSLPEKSPTSSLSSSSTSSLRSSKPSLCGCESPSAPTKKAAAKREQASASALALFALVVINKLAPPDVYGGSLLRADLRHWFGTKDMSIRRIYGYAAFLVKRPEECDPSAILRALFPRDVEKGDGLEKPDHCWPQLMRDLKLAFATTISDQSESDSEGRKEGPDGDHAESGEHLIYLVLLLTNSEMVKDIETDAVKQARLQMYLRASKLTWWHIVEEGVRQAAPLPLEHFERAFKLLRTGLDDVERFTRWDAHVIANRMCFAPFWRSNKGQHRALFLDEEWQHVNDVLDLVSLEHSRLVSMGTPASVLVRMYKDARPAVATVLHVDSESELPLVTSVDSTEGSLKREFSKFVWEKFLPPNQVPNALPLSSTGFVVVPTRQLLNRLNYGVHANYCAATSTLLVDVQSRIPTNAVLLTRGTRRPTPLASSSSSSVSPIETVVGEGSDVHLQATMALPLRCLLLIEGRKTGDETAPTRGNEGDAPRCAARATLIKPRWPLVATVARFGASLLEMSRQELMEWNGALASPYTIVEIVVD